MRHVQKSVDLSGWFLNSLDDASAAVKPFLLKAVEDAIALALADDATYAYFPIEWAAGPGDDFEGCDGLHEGKEVSDPLTVYMCVGLANSEETPVYAFSLRDALANSLAACAEDGSFSYGLGRLSESLRGLADEIDAARAKHSPRMTVDTT
jgi:hypothetical protein